MRKVISALVILLLVGFTFTGSRYYPKLDFAKLSASKVMNAVSAPVKTLFYLNNLCINLTFKVTNQKKMPLSSGRNKGKQSNEIIQFLILSIMSSILIPMTIKIKKPDFSPWPAFLKTFIEMWVKRFPVLDLVDIRCRAPANFGRENNNREIRAKTFGLIPYETEEDDSESDLDNKYSKFCNSIFFYNTGLKLFLLNLCRIVMPTSYEQADVPIISRNLIMRNYLLKKRKRTAVMDANCPIQKMNIHLIISAFVSARSTFVATLSRRVELFVSRAVSTASEILAACSSLKVGRSASKIFRVFAYAMKPPYYDYSRNRKFVNIELERQGAGELSAEDNTAGLWHFDGFIFLRNELDVFLFCLKGESIK